MKYQRLDNAYAVVTHADQMGIYLKLDNGEDGVAHGSMLPVNSVLLVTVQSNGREQGRFRRVSVDSVCHYGSALEILPPEEKPACICACSSHAA